MFVDSHLHLDFDEFSPDRAAVMQRARSAGVERFLSIGIKVRDFGRVLAVAEAHEDVYCTVGTLPHFADDEHDVTVAEIVAHTDHPKVVGVGEAGLDTFFGNASWEAQIAVFQAHIDAARQTQLPLIIHSVRQDEAMAEMLRAGVRAGAFPFVVHAFSGGPALAETALSLGGYLGFGGLLTYPEHDVMRGIAAKAPADRILLETDSPSLAPAPDQDQRNEPVRLLEIARLLAELRGIDISELGDVTTANFYRLFSKIPALSVSG